MYAFFFKLTLFLVFLSIIFTLSVLWGVDISNVKLKDHIELLAFMPVSLAVTSTTLNSYYDTRW